MTASFGPDIIDSHIHTWRLNDQRKIWTREKIGALSRDFTLDNFKQQNAALNLKGLIVVQAATDTAETLELLQLYADEPLVKGVVGWIDLAAVKIDKTVDELTRIPKFVGIRAHPPREFDTNWLMSDDVVSGMRTLAAAEVTIDYLVNTTQLNKFEAVLDKVPEVRAVLNHGGRPFVMTGDTARWKRDIHNIAANTQCYCKLSGLVERAGVEWNKETLKPWIDILLDAFGPERLIFASNWPIMTLMATPAIWANTLMEIFDDFGVPEPACRQILHNNALHVYRDRR